jgi:type IV pilus assembly protein PilW
MNSNSRWPTTVTKQHGLTLVEIMIAITISIVLLAGVERIFASSKHTYRVQDALSRVQESGRFASDFVTKDVRMAGYSGCSNQVPPVNMADVNGDGVADPYAEFSTLALEGYEYADLPVTMTNTQSLTAADVVANTDVIVTMSASPIDAFQLVGNMATVNANIQIGGQAAGLFVPNDILLISDCLAADVFAANNVSNGSGTITIAHSNSVNIGNFLTKTYGPDAMVMKLQKTAYYIGTNANGNPALFRKRLGSASTILTEELAEGVEDMQIQYGEDLSGDGVANRYVDADVADMAKVVSVRFGLLVETVEDNIATQPQDYAYMDQTITPTDKRLRRAFYKVTKLRNRGLL